MARRSAEERREEIVEIGFRHFAEGGYHGTSTEAIAREAGISQPYLFRLFRTKRELFLACVDLCFRTLAQVFAEAAAAAPPEDRLEAMGHAYHDRLLADRYALLMQMQGYIVDEPEIRAQVRANFRALVRKVAELAEVDEDDTWHFFATGMMLNVIAALDLDWIPWKT
jgi:AcrR family transcriptional regulator